MSVAPPLSTSAVVPSYLSGKYVMFSFLVLYSDTEKEDLNGEALPLHVAISSLKFTCCFLLELLWPSCIFEFSLFSFFLLVCAACWEGIVPSAAAFQ